MRPNADKTCLGVVLKGVFSSKDFVEGDVGSPWHARNGFEHQILKVAGNRHA
jgi:hypothetical protein